MEIEILADQNPWWKGKEKIEDDYQIRNWKKKTYRWIPPFVDNIGNKPFSLHILLGPRQVGKTTAVKLWIKKLLEGEEPRKIFYFNCEELADYKELSDVIETYLYLRAQWGISGSYIILDEITAPHEWYRTIKSLIDKGKLENDVLLLTGSSSIQVKRHAELFPGRRGDGETFVMLPLSFREFLKVRDPKLSSKLGKVGSLAHPEIEREAAKCMVFIRELNVRFEEYMGVGGFPLSIESGPTPKVKADYLAWVKTEILKDGRSDTIARQIIKALLEKMPSPISWESISKELEVKSPKTVSAYVDLFNSIYSLLTLHHIDISAKALKFGKNKKVHVIDPLLFEVFQGWAMVKLQNKKGTLAESIVASHLARLSSRKAKTTILDENIFYWRKKSEVDVIVDFNGLRGFEVKWTDKIDSEKTKKPDPHLKDFIILSKSKFEKGKPLMVPVSAFLAVLDA